MAQHICTLVVDLLIKVWVLFITVRPYTCRVTLVGATPLFRLLEPCHGSVNTSQQLSMHGTQSEIESHQLVAHKLWIKANNIKDLASELRDLFATVRIQSADYIATLNGDIVLSELTGEMLIRETEFVEILVDDYRKSAIAAVYVDQMRTDEENFPFANSYLTKFTTMESKLYEFMCTLKISIVANGASVPNVRSDVINPSFSSSPNYARLHIRDYIALRDIARFFTSLYQKYELLKSDTNADAISVENM